MKVFFFGDLKKQKEVDIDVYDNMNYIYYSKNFKDEEDEKYIVVTSEHDNPYKLMMETDFPFYSTFFYAKKSDNAIKRALDKDPSILENPFLGDVEENYKPYLKELFDTVYAYYNADYHNQGDGRVEEWLVTMEDPVTKRFIEIFKFKPNKPIEEKSWTEIFLTNPQFRQILTRTMFKTMEAICIKQSLCSLKGNTYKQMQPFLKSFFKE